MGHIHAFRINKTCNEYLVCTGGPLLVFIFILLSNILYQSSGKQLSRFHYIYKHLMAMNLTLVMTGTFYLLLNKILGT